MTAADRDTATDEPDRPVDPRSVVVWRWSAVLTFAPIIAGVLIFGMLGTLAPRSPPGTALWAALLLAVVTAAVVAWVWWYPPARYRHLAYRVDDVGITIRDGIFWHMQSALPRARIQHTDVSQGPLERRFGVATLKLYTAGSRFTRTELPGLEYAAAIELRDRLQQHVPGDAA